MTRGTQIKNKAFEATEIYNFNIISLLWSFVINVLQQQKEKITLNDQETKIL